MAVVEMTISGVLFDKLSRTTQQVVLVGEGSLTGLGIGGGPMPPGGGGGSPPGIWGGSNEGFPTQPGPLPPTGIWPGRPPGIWGGPIDPYPGHPLPPVVPVPPDTPNVPPPGSPPQVVTGTHPIHPVVPPQAVVIEYPGIGKVIVPQPLTAEPK